RAAGVCAGAGHPRAGPECPPRDRCHREAADGEPGDRHTAAAQCARADRRRVRAVGRRGLPPGEGPLEVSVRLALAVPRLPRLDPLGALLTALGAAALVLLPFVVLKPGRPRGCCSSRSSSASPASRSRTAPSTISP